MAFESKASQTIPITDLTRLANLRKSEVTMDIKTTKGISSPALIKGLGQCFAQLKSTLAQARIYCLTPGSFSTAIIQFCCTYELELILKRLFLLYSL